MSLASPATSSGGTTSPQDREPRFRVSPWLLLGTTLGASIAAAAAAFAIAERLTDAGGAAAIGAAVSAATALLGVAILRPSAERPASDWMTSWLAATVVRLLLTPLLAVSLYSALSLPGKPFLLAVAGTYLACLFAETAVLARAVGNALSQAAPQRGNNLPSGDRS